MDLPLTPDEYVDLRAAVDWPTMSAETAASALDASVAIATERDEAGRLVGMARAIGDGFYVIIVDVIVSPQQQDQGIASTLLSRLLDLPQVRDAGHLALFAAPDAVELYESFGFRDESGVYMRRPA
jgi:ribosomal protein S18 acetylase RimI-like enzyme